MSYKHIVKKCIVSTDGERLAKSRRLILNVE